MITAKYPLPLPAYKHTLGRRDGTEALWVEAAQQSLLSPLHVGTPFFHLSIWRLCLAQYGPGAERTEVMENREGRSESRAGGSGLVCRGFTLLSRSSAGPAWSQGCVWRVHIPGRWTTRPNWRGSAPSCAPTSAVALGLFP